MSVYRIWSCWFWNCYRLEDFQRNLILPTWISVNKLVIPGGIPFLGWIPRLWAGNSRRNPLLSRVGWVLEHCIPSVLLMVIIPGFLTIMQSKCWHIAIQMSFGWQQFQDSLLPCIEREFAHRVPKVLQMVTFPGFFTQKNLYRRSIFSKSLNMKTSIKWKINMIHLIRPSNLFNELKKGYLIIVILSL
jgi:hypothetical protein